MLHIGKRYIKWLKKKKYMCALLMIEIKIINETKKERNDVIEMQ